MNRQTKIETSFLPLPLGNKRVILVSRTSSKAFLGGNFYGSCGWGGPDIRGLVVALISLSLEALNFGGWLAHGDIRPGHLC